MTDNVPLEVDVLTVSHWLRDREDLVLLDCREQAEADVVSIDGAVLIPMSEWAMAGSKLEAFNGKHIVVHCHHGGRSLRVANWLRANGFPDAQSMAGGIDAWSIEVDPTKPRY